MLQKKITKNFAFTLLEMAITLVIIAIIASMITIGKVIVSNSKADVVIADIKKFSKAVDQFEKLYGGLPGDLADVTKLPTGSVTPAAGNGNGVIDSTAESLNFWLELANAGLLPGNFDASSTYIATNGLATGGIPAGSAYLNSGYSVSSTYLAGNVITISGGFAPSVSAGNYTTAILTPLDAQYIDKKMDDGNPNTGIVRGYDGSNVAAGSCVSGNSYAISNTSPSCYMTFMLSPHHYEVSTPGVNTCSGGAPVGASRISSTTYCDWGHNGYTLESCAIVNGTTAWVTIRTYCEHDKCGYGLSNNLLGYNQCSPLLNGYISQYCTNVGGFWYNNATSPQTECTQSFAVNSSCVANSTIATGCPVGYTGRYYATCNGSGNAVTVNNTCVPIACAYGGKIGYDTNPFPAVNPCSIVYGGSSNYTGSSTGVEACVLPSNGSVANYRLMYSFCTPIYATGCSNGQVKDISCPRGQMGNHRQICNQGVYQTLFSTCTAVLCGDQPIGTVRPAQGLTCPASNPTGFVYEVCDYTDLTNYQAATWYANYSSCY